MFFYDSKILNPNLAPDWFANVKVIEITPNPGVSGTDPIWTCFTRVLQLASAPVLLPGRRNDLTTGRAIQF